MAENEVLKSFADRKVLVTGGSGLIGRQLVDILIVAGSEVKVVSLDKIEISSEAEYIYGDLADFGFCKEVTRGVDFVFHVAGIKGSIEITKKKPASFFVPLLMMNTNVLEASRLNRVKKVLFTSSIGAYAEAEIFREDKALEGAPMDMFPGWAKRMAELQVESYRIQYGLKNFSVVRLANVYGPGDNFNPENAMVIPALMHKIYHKEDPVVIWGDGSAVRDFLYSRDAAEGLVQAFYYGSGSGFLNLGSGRGYTIRELVEALHSFVNFNYTFDVTKSEGFSRRVMDISLAKKIIHYHPQTTLLEGLKETWDWFKKNPDEYLKKKNYFI